MTDNVNHPKHYQMPGGIEAIYMIANVLGPMGFVNYCWGNALKYICRWREKGGVESLDKAIWYINMMRDMESGKNIMEEGLEKAAEALDLDIKKKIEKLTDR